MRTISVKELIDPVARMCEEASYDVSQDIEEAFRKSLDIEESEAGKEVLQQLLENARIAREESIPICQDTGFAVFFIELGQDIHLVDGSLRDAINEGVRKGYGEGYLRKSILGDPIQRKNTGDNTPAVLHINIVPGEKLKIIFSAKGGGSENMSTVQMLKPSDGIEGVKRLVLDRVSQAGPNPCPPIVVGVGIGGTFEIAALIAKKALLRHIGSRHPDPFYAALENELLEKVNKLGIGPQGFGGRVTALDVHVEVHPCHIASLPCAVNINCHASRHREIVF
jgi:fumarate hydratase subunit alpha